MNELTQKGSVPMAVIVLVVAGIAVGIYLLVNGTGFFPSAQENYQPAVQTEYVPGGPAAPNTYVDK